MKAYKKIISFILTLVMMLSLSVNVFAAEPLTDDPNMIEWKYTVFADESLQKVVEEGVIPNAYARYTWRGITLKNGEVAILTPSNNSMGLYCNSGRYITINYTLSRSAFHRSRVRAYVAGPSSEFVREITASGLRSGFTTQAKGKVVDIEELAKSSSEFPESRIVKSSLMPNFIPSSIVEIPTDKSDEMYIIPEIILINNSLCVLTQDNGKGWELTDKDNIVISFDKYKSDITVSQDLIIGYVKDGIMYEGEVFDELSGKYSFSPDEKGEYFFYLLSGSSDYLSLKSGNLEVN